MGRVTGFPLVDFLVLPIGVTLSLEIAQKNPKEAKFFDSGESQNKVIALLPFSKQRLASIVMSAIEDLNTEVISCRSCNRLVEWREQVAKEKRAAYSDQNYWGKPVPSFGDPSAHLLIVGLAPAAHGANRTGRMFTGDRSGDFLFAALHRVGYASQNTATSREDGMKLTGAYITAPLRCAPPQNKPTAEELNNCRSFFKRELELLENVKVILALGGIGYSAIAKEFDLRPKPKFMHGLEVLLPDQRILLCSYHVSQQNTFTGRLTEEMFDTVLMRARELST